MSLRKQPLGKKFESFDFDHKTFIFCNTLDVGRGMAEAN